MKIQVTAEDISRGEAGDNYGCPIALAARRAGIDVAVGTDKVLTRRSGVRYLLPPEAVMFIEKFDRKMMVEPFEFDLGGLYDEQGD